MAYATNPTNPKGEFMSAIARWCFSHRLAVIATWVVVLAGLSVLAQAVKTDYNTSFSVPGTGSATAQELLARAVPAQAGDSDTIVWKVSNGTVRDDAVTARMAGVLQQIAALPEVAAVTSPYGPHGAAQISRDGRIAYATVYFTGQADNLVKADVTRMISTAEAARAPGLDVQLGGQAIESAQQTSVGVISAVGVLAAAVVLFIAFGSLLAALLPIVTAIAGVGGGLMAIAGRRGDGAWFRRTVGALVRDSRTQASRARHRGRGGHGHLGHPGAQCAARLL